jgi:precorrin-2/cobalt-factor-2 C20-methyltransferase
MRKSSLYLPDRLKAELSARSAATGRSEADIIRAAVAEALARPAEPANARIDPPVPGRFVGIGVGPGDAELLTVQAVRAIRRADVVLAPTTAVDAVGRAETIVRTAIAEVRVERVAFSMAPSRSRRDTSLRQAAEVVVGHLAQGREVAWITLGDPLVYSTFSAVAARVRRKRPGTAVAQVPGIMAFQALAARTGTVVADERTRLVVRTALDGDDLTTDLADRESTVVVYKGGRRLPELGKEVDAVGRTDGAVAGELLGLPGERVGALSALAGDGPASYLATVIVPVKGRGG